MAQMTVPIAAHSENDHNGITPLDIAAFVWMAGGLLLMSVHLISYLCYKRQVSKDGVIVKEPGILRQLFEVKRELHIKCTVRIVEYSEAASPMMIGFLKPLLILPDGQYSSEELFFILKHELVHLKRRDVYVKLLFVVVMQNRTSIVIAHRISTIRDADIIVVMDHGRIVESGDHDTLLSQKGKYYELYMTQYAGLSC